MNKKTKARASRDLFSVSLDLDIIEFKLKNIKEDLEESGDSAQEVEDLRGLLLKTRDLQSRAYAVRRGWENAESK